ncbi:MAG: GTP-binding protein LepA [Candidatus Magasanikbacteria bacterium]|nr:GTP-binding protein LepA [Candidatus Magasanikbacteria bacterium]
MNNIRNFCIIAHVDHGKSTLADRLLEFTGTVPKREMKEQMLDTMDIERERGITIKLQPARMVYNRQQITNNKQQTTKQSDAGKDENDEYILNLIDTPGHVDFNYEVSRSLAAVEGALLLVDATQGVQAQTLANLYLALEQNLTIIPVVNKVDLPNAQIEQTKKEICELIGCRDDDVILASGKTGEGVEKILDAIVERVPTPAGNAAAPFRSLIFDSRYDDYKGVVASVRVVDGLIRPGDTVELLHSRAKSEVMEIGVYTPKLVVVKKLSAGEIGYVVSGVKDISLVSVGDTIAASPAEPGAHSHVDPLPGYQAAKPMVFAGIFPKEGDGYARLRDAMERLKLNDAAMAYEPEHSAALGYGFRVGLLGLLHLEIVQERLRREYGMDIVVTTPSVAYRVTKTNGDVIIIKSPVELPDPSWLKEIEEPWVRADIITPKEFLGGIMQLVSEKRGRYLTMEFLGERALLHYELPLASILVDFYDRLKSVSSGYASLNYELKNYELTDVVRLDILVAEEVVEALAQIIWRDEAYKIGRVIVEKLKESLPKQMFEVKLQAAIGGKVIAAERLSALRKDVMQKMSGGDVTRKRKLLEKQKKGKKKMMGLGRGSVDIPAETYLAVLKR